MVNALPFAIVLGVIGTMGFAVYAAWGRIEGYLAKFVGSFSADLERAGLRVTAERLGAIVGTVTVVLWLAAVIGLRPSPLIAILYIPASFALTALGFRFWIKRKVKKRLKAFDEQLELALLTRYIKARRSTDGSFDPAGFAELYAIMSAQRNTKLLGIFARLNRRDGKPQYLRHQPRIWTYLTRSLAHPALAGIREWYSANVPPPVA